MTKWISVKDSYPIPETKVLAFNDKFMAVVFYQRAKRDCGHANHHDNALRSLEDKKKVMTGVTHWMRLPDLPEI